MTTVLVTGASGFVGRNVVDELSRIEGYRVFTVSRQAISNPRASHLELDLFNEEATHAVLRELQPSHLIHTAWYAEPGRFWASPESLRWVAASLNLFLEFAKHGGSRAVFVGSCAEYDWRHEYLSEVATPLWPSTLYGVSKLSLARMLEVAGRQMGVSIAWARLFFLYGPCERPERFVPSLILALLAGIRASCRNGNFERDFLHVADVGRALCAILASDITGPVNVASGTCVALRHVAETIGSIIGRPELVEVSQAPQSSTEPKRMAADVQLLQNIVDFRPSYDLITGLGETISWWKRRGTPN